ncbi:NUDIX domain-containing protein, partial [Enterobacter hormaechei subsp. steigerwaltii]|nr:NUDIX domain-containing protein [Enterobacter hormaechei subsp. steigerwaltii]
PIAPEFRYREADPSGIVENEICPVYAARVTNTLAINDDEVMEYQWVELDALFRALDATPWAFSPWMVQEANTAREKLSAFAAQ